MATGPSATPNNLPANLTSFVGREREIAEIRRLVAKARLLTLTGPGGCGKSRLAIEVARGMLSDFPDGARVVELAPLFDPMLVPQAVAAVVGVQEQSGESMIATVGNALRAKTLLLVLDNFEHLRAACAPVANALLQNCPSLRILATSREPLGVPGETIWRVPPLSLPEMGRLQSLDEIARVEAVRLFVERGTAHSGFQLTPHNVQAVAQVCRRLDGIPLAIELAAARVRVLAVEQIAARLDDRFQLLTGGSQIVLPQHQTLRATMEWSHDLLGERERAVLRRLAVFAGGWSLEAAEAICAGDGLAERDILDLLMQLVDKSIVVSETGGTEARYRLLETVREYAQDRLAEAGEVATIRNRHFEWYLDLAQRAERKFYSPEEATWLEHLEGEHENLRAALEWSGGRADPAPGLRFAVALARFWQVRTHFAEGRRWLERVTARAENASPVLRAKALVWLAKLAKHQGDEACVLGLAGEALAIFQAHGDRSGIADALHMLAHGEEAQGDHARAAATMERSRTLFRAIGDAQEAQSVTNCMGDLARMRGDYAGAAALFEEALAACDELGNPWGKRAPLHNLGCAVLRLGDRRRATALFRGSLALARGLGSEIGMICCLAGLAGVCAQGARPDQGAMLLGAVDGLLARGGLHLESPERADFAHYVAMTRGKLAEREFAAAWAAGAALSLEAALAAALSPEETAEDISSTGPPSGKAPLTPREREVAALIAQGLSNREIAARLVVAERTAEGHVQNILNKLGVGSRTQVAVWAVEHGLRAERVDRQSG